MINEKILTQIVSLGEIFEQLAQENPENGHQHAKYIEQLQAASIQAKIKNAWFTPKEIKRSFKSWARALNETKLREFCQNIQAKPSKKVALICAGNIPMVGFHDLLSILLCGHHAYLKPSSDDTPLMTTLATILADLVPAWKEKITIVERVKSTEVDALIATGSDNTARYFEYYFKALPKIIRKNRTSLAILTEETTDDDLKALAEDIFAYYGLGCRNVSKLFVPVGFDVQRLFAIMPDYAYLDEHHKYMNNYTYNKALYLLNQEKFLENGFFLLLENDRMHSPISALFYEEYSDRSAVDKRLEEMADSIQCIVDGKQIAFGQAQQPSLLDFADNIDTREFLATI